MEKNKKGLPISKVYGNTIANEKGGPFYEITMRPATKLPKIITRRKVAAYCRVSTQQEIQHNSLEAQLEKVDAQKATLKQKRNIRCSSASLMLCQFPSL